MWLRSGRVEKKGGGYRQTDRQTDRQRDTAALYSRINNNLSFKVRYRRTSKKALIICVKGSKMWNALSPDIKLTRNINAFMKMLKASLLENYKF